MSINPELVCIVDDDQSVRRAVRRLFKSAGYSAEIFASAEDYLAREVFDGPSCLVLDVRMPGLNGLGLQEALEPRGAGEQIIFLTGYGDVPTCKQAMKKGAVDFLIKPFDDEELLGAVQRALGRSEDYLRKRAERREARERIDKLTPREFEVLALRHYRSAQQTDRGRAADGGKRRSKSIAAAPCRSSGPAPFLILSVSRSVRASRRPSLRIGTKPAFQRRRQARLAAPARRRYGTKVP